VSSERVELGANAKRSRIAGGFEEMFGRMLKTASAEWGKARVSAGINSITVWFFPDTDLRAAPRTSIVLAAFPYLL